MFKSRIMYLIFGKFLHNINIVLVTIYTVYINILYTYVLIFYILFYA